MKIRLGDKTTLLLQSGAIGDKIDHLDFQLQGDKQVYLFTFFTNLSNTIFPFILSWWC